MENSELSRNLANDAITLLQAMAYIEVYANLASDEIIPEAAGFKNMTPIEIASELVELRDLMIENLRNLTGDKMDMSVFEGCQQLGKSDDLEAFRWVIERDQNAANTFVVSVQQALDFFSKYEDSPLMTGVLASV